VNGSVKCRSVSSLRDFIVVKINELFDKPYQIGWVVRSKGGWHGKATVADGGVLHINFNPIMRDGSEWEINFSRDGATNFNATGTGDEIKIFSTVVAAVKEWYAEISKQGWPDEPLRAIEFTAKKDSSDTSSRVRLYDRFAKQFASQINMTVHRNERTDYVEWTLKKPKKKKVREVTVDNRNGRGATPNNAEIDYFGMRVKMRPTTFVKLAAPLGRDQAKQEMIDYIKDGGAIGAPFLIININGNNVEVVGHEGRNRMLAVYAAEGDDPIETHLFFRGDISRARQLTPEIVQKIKAGMSQENTGKSVPGPLWEDGKIVKGVNTTVDVKPGETKRQAAKFGNKVNSKNEPPLLNAKARKNSSPHVLSNLGLAESTQLNELFDKKYNWTWNAAPPGQTTYARFTTDSGETINSAFEPLPRGMGVEFEFTRGGSSNVTGGGDAFKIFATVMAQLAEYVEKYQPKRVKFTAEKNTYNDSNETARIKLYTRLVKKFAAGLGYSFKTSDMSRGVNFMLTRIKDPKKTPNGVDEMVNENSNQNELQGWLASLEELMEDIDDRSQMNQSKEENTELMKDYQACLAVRNVIRNNLIAIRNDRLKNNIFQYNIDPENDVWGGIHAQIQGEVAEIKWIGSYNSSGRNLMNNIKPELKAHGVKKLKLVAKWESEGFYTKMNFKKDGDTKADPISGATHTDMSKGIDEAIKKPHPSDTLGVARDKMPQVHKNHYPELFRYLADHGATMSKGQVPANKLKAVQSEFSDQGVEKMMSKAANAKGTTRKKPLIVSSDNYIIDGHHRWLASYNLDENVPIIKFSIPVKKLLQLVRDFKHTTYKDIYNEEGSQNEKKTGNRGSNSNRRTNERRST